MRNNGFTLVEMMVALFIFAVFMLGLASGYILSMNLQARNYLRDEATRIINQTFNEYRSASFSTLESDFDNATCTPDNSSSHSITRPFRNSTKTFGRKLELVNKEKIGGLWTAHVGVKVCWEYKNKNYSKSEYSIIKE